MANVPAKVSQRITSGLRKYKKVFAQARDRDINESDTVVIIADFLSEVLKREVVVGEDARSAGARVKRAATRALRKAGKTKPQVPSTEAPKATSTEESAEPWPSSSD